MWPVITIKRAANAAAARWWSLFCVISIAVIKSVVEIIAYHIGVDVVKTALNVEKDFFGHIRCNSCCRSRRRRCCGCCMFRWMMWSHVWIDCSISTETDWWMGVFVRRLSASRQIIRPISLFIRYRPASTIRTISKWSHCSQMVWLLLRRIFPMNTNPWCRCTIIINILGVFFR